ncbi:fungal-specific transcription factor domain-containing protein [Coniochaeta sp. 2T2.1]|nr:fungal-specific transcription factor domain-containing protein [Coniochaeta sp. 2T2.1]
MSSSQTFGEEAPPAPPPPAQPQSAQVTPAPATSHKPQRILACVLCQQRKIKCDRQFPCSKCRAQGIKCQPSKPAPARKRRRPHEDLQQRLAGLEAMLTQLTGERPASPFSKRGSSSTANAGATPGSVEGQAGDWASATPASVKTPQSIHELGKHGRLVKEDGGTRFMDSQILGHIYESVREMRDIVDADDNDEPSPDNDTPDDHSELVLGTDTPQSISLEDLWPDSGHVFRLWQIYLDRVNPLTKIIHVPTLQKSVVEATAGSANLPKNIEALLFSIWLMAAVAMTPDECQVMLGYSRDEALRRFSNGVRTALLQLNFLQTHDVSVLQAFVIYLISLQGRYNPHASWILNGTAIRMAQKMGLHCDGETLGLSPFECEMRRRLWWQIVMLDAKYAMMTGLKNSSLPTGWNTKEPKNLDDKDMDVSDTEPYQDHKGPTEMIFVMITNKVARFLVETPGLEMMLMLAEWSGMESKVNPELNEFRKKIEGLGHDLLGMLEDYCNPAAGKVHQMAVEVKKQIITKLEALAIPPTEQAEWGSEIMNSRDNAFKLAICAMEHEQENCVASQDKGFLWHALLHFQLDVFLYLAGELCERLDGALVDRAWKQVQPVYYFHPELFDMSNKKHLMLARYLLKAWSKHSDKVYQKTGNVPVAPECIQRLQASLPGEEIKADPDETMIADLNPYRSQFPAAQQMSGTQDWEMDMFAASAIQGNEQNENPPPPNYFEMNPLPWG